MKPHARLPEIEVLRGLAVAGVVLHHAHGNLLVAPHRGLDWLRRCLDYGNGVDLFFVISGFVIARALLPAIAAGTGARDFVTVAGSFWIRRAWRLLPSAWLWLLLVLAASAGFNRAGLFGSVATNFWAMLAGVFDYANVRFAYHFGKSFYGASFAWWSLSLEEQFYLVLPPMAFLAGRWLKWLLLGAALLQFPLRPHSVLQVAFRTEPILLGVLLAEWEATASFGVLGRRLAAAPPAVRVALPIGLILALGVLGVRGPAPRFMIGLTALVSAALVYLAAQDRGLILPDGLPRRFMLWLGARSYALYLIHVPAFFAAREIWFRIGKPGTEIPVALTAAALLVVGAELNWRLVEQPLRAYGARVAARWTKARKHVLF